VAACSERGMVGSLFLSLPCPMERTLGSFGVQGL
jgi:hypothetical protein